MHLLLLDNKSPRILPFARPPLHARSTTIIILLPHLYVVAASFVLHRKQRGEGNCSALAHNQCFDCLPSSGSPLFAGFSMAPTSTRSSSDERRESPFSSSSFVGVFTGWRAASGRIDCIASRRSLPRYRVRSITRNSSTLDAHLIVHPKYYQGTGIRSEIIY